MIHPKTKNFIHSGFTLTEILIVVTILVILGVSVLININPLAQFLKGYDTVRKADLAKIKTAFEAYYADHDCYPTVDMLSQCGSDALAPYLNSIPCDPNSGKPYTIDPKTGLPYAIYSDPNFDSQTCPQKYIIYADMANKKDPNGDLITLCPDKIAITSTNNQFLDTVRGCSGKNITQNLYGCKDYQCQLLFVDTVPTCGFTYDTPNCGGRNCKLYSNRCR